MKNLLKVGALGLALSAFTATEAKPGDGHVNHGHRHHRVRAATHSCALTFGHQNEATRWYWGRTKFVSYGAVQCHNLRTQSSENFPVVVSFATKAIGAQTGLGVGNVSVVGRITPVKISLFGDSAYDLLGTYIVVGGQASLWGGVGAFTAFKLGLPSVHFQIGLEAVQGWGANVAVTAVAIDLDRGQDLSLD